MYLIKNRREYLLSYTRQSNINTINVRVTIKCLQCCNDSCLSGVAAGFIVLSAIINFSNLHCDLSKTLNTEMQLNGGNLHI